MPRACPTCGSRKWRKDAVTGNAVCEEGHIFQDFRSENLDIDPLVGYALQKRRMRVGERVNQRKVHGRANKAFYHGDEGEYLKLEAMQLLLRYQVAALRKLWSLPAVYEAIVRDLWTYQLAISPLPPMPDGATPTSDSDPPMGDEGLVEMDEEHEQTEGGEDEKADGSDVSLEERYRKEEEMADEELLRRLSDPEDGDLEDEPPDTYPREEGQKGWRRGRRLVISDTIVTLVLGLWILRYPILNVSIERAINSGGVPYLDFCNTTLCPPGMRAHMGRELVLALSPRMAPGPLQTFHQCRLLAKTLSHKFGVIVPPVNASAVVWKTISPLGGSPTIYDQVLRLLGLLNVQLGLLPSTSRRVTANYRRGTTSRPLSRSRTRSRTRMGDDGDTQSSDEDSSDAMPAVRTRTRIVERPTRYHQVLLPELAVVAAWVIILKMAYGLDGETRFAISPSEPLGGMPDGESFLPELKLRSERGELKGTAWGTQRHDFTRMGEDELDTFLALAEGALLHHRPPPPVDVSLFPLPPPPPHPTPTSRGNDWTTWYLRAPYVHPLEVPLDTAPRSLPLQPGEDLRIYDQGDPTGTLPPDLDIALSAAADVVGVEQEEVLRIVGVFERRLRKIGRARGRGRNDSRSTSVSGSGSRSRSQSRTGDLRRMASTGSLRSR